MKKVMLINPPQKYYERSTSFSLYFPLGLLSVAAAIKDTCNVKILDCLVSDFKIKEAGEFVLYGTSFEKIETEIKNFDPDIVGISVPFSAQSENAIAISRICKKINPNKTVVFGGPHASIRYNQLLENDSCDFCVVGEGEEAFFEFVKNYQAGSFPKNIDGLAYKKNNTIHYKPAKPIKNLDSLPPPAYELIDIDDYLESRYLYASRSSICKKSISMITSRGCPFNCVFCSIKLHMGQKYRCHSGNYVLDHMKLLIKKYGITNFHFEDDNISLNKLRFEQILDGIIGSKLGIKWDIPNGIRVDSLDFNLLKKIKKSGCESLTIAIESGSQHVLDKIIKKNISLDQMLEIVKFCKRLRIKLCAFYVIGFPGETINDMKKTVDLALRLFTSYHVSPALFCATPLYGTELYNICVKEGLISKGLTDRQLSTATGWFGEPLISTSEFSKEDVKKVTKDFQRSLQREKTKYYIKHPFMALNKVTRPALLKRYLQEVCFLRQDTTKNG